MTYDEVLAALSVENELRRKRTKGLMVLAAVLVGLQAAGFGYMVGSGSESFESAFLSILPTACFFGIAAGLTPRAKSLLSAAIESGDERVIGHLADALTSGEQGVIEMAREALVRLLPTLKPGAPPLDKIQHQALIMRMPVEDDLYVMSVIKGLGVIGRPESIPVLESIARDKRSAYVKGSPARFKALALAALADLRIALASETIQRKIDEVDALRAQLLSGIPSITAPAPGPAGEPQLKVQAE